MQNARRHPNQFCSEDTISEGTFAYLVSITTDTCYTFYSEIERLYSETVGFQEGHDKATQATIDV